MSHDVHQVRSFEHPGEGRRRAKSAPKGRQIEPQAAEEISLCWVTGYGVAIS